MLTGTSDDLCYMSVSCVYVFKYVIIGLSTCAYSFSLSYSYYSPIRDFLTLISYNFVTTYVSKANFIFYTITININRVKY